MGKTYRGGSGWGKAGRGKYYKGRAARAERRHAKAIIRDGDRAHRHAGGLIDIRSDINWRGT